MGTIPVLWGNQAHGPEPWLSQSCSRLPEQRGRMTQEKLSPTPQSCQPQASTHGQAGTSKAGLPNQPPRQVNPCGQPLQCHFRTQRLSPAFRTRWNDPVGPPSPWFCLPPILLQACHSGHSPHNVGFVPCLASARLVPFAWASLPLLQADSGAPSSAALRGPLLGSPWGALWGTPHLHSPTCTAPHFSPELADLNEGWELLEVGGLQSSKGLRLGPIKLSSATQPDLGAQRGEGQVLPVLHHGNGWRHEHLGREGES